MAGKLNKILPLILHTRNGSKLCLYCINYGAAKDRKAIIKSFKGLITKISKEEFGHVSKYRNYFSDFSALSNALF